MEHEVRRWLKMMPHEILEGNPWEKGTKTRVKEWVKDNVRRRGLDSILWGRWEQCEEKDEGEEETGKMTGGESPKSRNPPTSRKQETRRTTKEDLQGGRTANGRG